MDATTLHMANGMFGAVVIDPPDPAPFAHEYVLVQSEMFLGPQAGAADEHKLRADTPDLVVFNGHHTSTTIRRSPRRLASGY
ncbi:MAG: hypothetical protein ABI251_13960 [Mycobacteriaceae bacterium]